MPTSVRDNPVQPQKFPHLPCHGFPQYIVRLVANEHSNGGPMLTVIAVRLSRRRDTDNASHIPKTRGCTNEESRQQNSRKIPTTFLNIACCKLVLLTHSTKFVFPLFSSTTLSPLNLKRLPMSYLSPYIGDCQNNKKRLSQSRPINLSKKHHSQNVLGGSPQKCALRSPLYATCKETLV